MASQAPIKVNAATKERIRYIAALTDVTQAEVVDRAIEEYAARHADVIAKGIDHARHVLSAGDVGIAAYLLNVPVEDVKRIAGGSAGRLPQAEPHDFEPLDRASRPVVPHLEERAGEALG